MVQHLHNYNLDVLPQVLRVSTHDGLRNTFVHERRHKIVKKYSNELHNAQVWFERSVLLDQSLTHLQHLQGEDLEDLPKFLRCGNLCLFGAPRPSTAETMQSGLARPTFWCSSMSVLRQCNLGGRPDCESKRCYPIQV